MSNKVIVPEIGDFENVEIIEILVKSGDKIKKITIKNIITEFCKDTFIILVGREGLEPSTSESVALRSIQLS